MHDLWDIAVHRRLTHAELKRFLERVANDYHHESFLPTDPVEYLWRYRSPLDQEVVGLVSALLAYGNVRQIRTSCERVWARLERLGRLPSEAVRQLIDPQVWRAELVAWEDFKHRFNTGKDVLVLLRLIAEAQAAYGSLGSAFCANLAPAAPHFGEALSAWIDGWRERAKVLCADSSFQFFLTDPARGGACKRWCLFLRWMGRKDSVDAGLWMNLGQRSLRPHQLIIPLDTHLAKIVRRLRLSGRKSVDWKMATEVTARLREVDPHDPIRYDFALCRLGILKKI